MNDIKKQKLTNNSTTCNGESRAYDFDLSVYLFKALLTSGRANANPTCIQSNLLSEMHFNFLSLTWTSINRSIFLTSFSITLSSPKPITDICWASLRIFLRSNSIKADSEINEANDRLGRLTFSNLYIPSNFERTFPLTVTVFWPFCGNR